MSKIIELHKPCPKPCGSSDAYCKWDDGHGYCFSCQTFFENDRSDDAAQCTFEYVPWRGVSKESFQFYDVKTKIAPNGEPIAIGFPYPSGATKYRHLDKKDFRWKGDVTPGLFGMDKFTPGASKYITITEGELDAISLRQALRDNSKAQSSTTDYHVVSVQSASTAVRDCASVRPWLNQYDRILLCFDEDPIGQDAARRVAALFDGNKVFHVRLRPYKDANEFLQVDPAALRELWWKAKKFMLDTITSTFADMRKVLEQPDPPSVPFPWQSWNNSLYGLRCGESYLITALEGVGKTEVMHHLEYHLLKETEANVGSIFLEERSKDHYKALARLELGKAIHLPHQAVDSDAIAAAVEKVAKRDERLFVHSNRGSDDPNTILDTIRFLVTTCDCHYIFLDHIGMACIGLQGENERIALDYLSNRLQMMVVELGFCLLFVSHVNDQGETRGSRMIAKVANNRINLFRDVANGELTTHVTITKNRFGSKTGPLQPLCFNPVTFAYTEKEMDDDRHQDRTNESTGNGLWGDRQGKEVVDREHPNNSSQEQNDGTIRRNPNLSS